MSSVLFLIYIRASHKFNSQSSTYKIKLKFTEIIEIYKINQ